MHANEAGKFLGSTATGATDETKCSCFQHGA